MNSLNVKKGDTVVVISGKDKGKKGKIMISHPEDERDREECHGQRPVDDAVRDPPPECLGLGPAADRREHRDQERPEGVDLDSSRGGSRRSADEHQGEYVPPQAQRGWR